MKTWFTINLKILVCLLLLILSTVGLAEETISGDLSEKKRLDATIIDFSEYEQGAGQYPVSMMITSDFLRIDDTEEGKDFVLFDRKNKTIYSVNSEEQQIIQINYQPVTLKSPIELSLREAELKLAPDAPSVAGKKPRHHQFFVNEKLCYEVISVPGLMSDVVNALKHFKQVLAGQQAETLRSIPADLQEDCELFRHIYYPQRYLDKGFPVMEKEGSDVVKYSRSLTRYYDKKVPAQRFALPDYPVIKIN